MILANPAVKVLFTKALSGRNLADFADELIQQKTLVLKSVFVNIRQKELFEDLGVTETQNDNGQESLWQRIEQCDDSTHKQELERIAKLGEECEAIQERYRNSIKAFKEQRKQEVEQKKIKLMTDILQTRFQID